ncbi:MAG: hypothetical protein QGI21_06860 [Candidatus Poseidoniaceae archaeon]|jgi:hypothetical protein|nr:hypothetical protein [Candidatus Poseidoniaceae archaeon]
MVSELTNKVYEAIITSGKSSEELATDFLLKNGYRTDKWGSLILEPRKGWVVLKIPSRKDGPNAKVDFENFSDESEAKELANKLYPNSTPEWINSICYEGIVHFDKCTKAKKKTIDLDDNDELNQQQIIEANKARIIEKIDGFLNKHENSTKLGLMRYPTSDDAVEAFLEVVKQNNMTIAHNLKQLRAQDQEGNWYVRDSSQWKDKYGNKEIMPKIPEPIQTVNSIAYDNLGFLVHFYDYFFNQEQATIAYALALGHLIINESNPVRSALDGDDVIGIFESSDLTKTIISMTKLGFDIQPIMSPTGECIGAIRLQDVLKFISEEGEKLLPKNFELKTLKKLGLLLPSPPILDGRGPLSDAESILKSGSDGILVRVNPETWWDEETKDVISSTLKPGLHMMTSHDITAYHLSK